MQFGGSEGWGVLSELTGLKLYKCTPPPLAPVALIKACQLSDNRQNLDEQIFKILCFSFHFHTFCHNREKVATKLKVPSGC